MIIYPIGSEVDLTTETAVFSAIFISVLNTESTNAIINIIDLDGNIVSFFTMTAEERLVIRKPDCYTLSADGNVKAFPVIRQQ